MPNLKPEIKPTLTGKKERGKKIEVVKGVETAKKAVSETVASPSEITKEIPSAAPSTTAAPYLVKKKDKLTSKIEDVLSEDLSEMYKALPFEKKKEFKQKGEETSGLIRKMIETGKINTNKILNLIRKWLKLIPGVNKFFLEQEAKIKADKIIDIAEEGKS